jgi:hypothetical protein
MAAGASTRLNISAAIVRQARDGVGKAEEGIRVMLARPDEKERGGCSPGLEAGREQIGLPLLQVILVSKSNKVTFFHIL